MVLETQGFIILSADDALARGVFSIEDSRGGEVLTVCGKFDAGTMGGMRIVDPWFDMPEAPLVMKDHDDGRISGLQLNRKHNRKKSKRR